jgi:Bacterial type II/III secretion system short domain
VQGLRTERNTPPVSLQPGGKTVFNVFALKHAKAAAVAKALHDLFPEKDGLTLRIASEPTLNTVVIRGSREESDVVEAIITRLEAVAQEQNGK